MLIIARYWPRIVLASLVFCVLIGLLVPLYTDEVGWRLQARAALDGVDKLYVDVCGPNTLAVPPAFMMPVRAYSAFFNTAFPEPLYVRLSGVLYALVWIAMLAALTRHLASDEQRQRQLRLVAFALPALGMLPLLLVWSRPEQPILLCLTGALIIAVRQRVPAAPLRAQPVTSLLASSGVVVLAAIAMSYHIKALVLLPVFLLCLVSVGLRSGSWTAPVVGTIATIAASKSAASYWLGRFACPDDPKTAAFFAKQNVGFKALRDGDFAGSVAALADNVNLVAYAILAGPARYPQTKWLEPEQISFQTQYVWTSLVVFCWGVLVVLSAVHVALGIGRMQKFRSFDPQAMISAALMACAMAWAATQIGRNVYEATFVLPILLLAGLLALAQAPPQDPGLLGRITNRLVVLLSAVAITAPALIAASYGSSLLRAARAGGYVPGQAVSVSAYHYADVRPLVEAAARRCKIENSPRSRNVMIDDLSYFALMKTYRPQHVVSVTLSPDLALDDPLGYLRSIGSDGLVVRCQYLPLDLQRRAHRFGPVCCMARDEL
ncbi:hypothetical protein B0I00_2845 [Novosphingobium kunmingense]|uniref:4-amino-4-deoxy-L-arabinose transferase-like glycosyltransferase n=1 Tax=Novosphingobium kunmingense TaxID=1211806 RepID=A0A2N0H5J5_9SPHN|nr:hypothetical protein [Novosphingobium kunmingense]PKB14213.1 hypothetical protein B0I00_2845 [Novosphingobium kunmingense]